MTPNIIHGYSIRNVEASPEPHGHILHGYDWFYQDGSAQGEPLMYEELTRYGQPISCSIIDRGLVFISYGHESLWIRERIQTTQIQEHPVFLNETHVYPDPDVSFGWDPDSDQRLSAFAAGYRVHQPDHDPAQEITVPDYSGQDLQELLAAAITSTDIGIVILGTEDLNFFGDPRVILLGTTESLTLPEAQTPTLAIEVDAEPVASGEPSATDFLPTPHIIEKKYQARIDHLQAIAEDEDIFFSSESCRDFWLFIRSYCPSPQAGLILTDEGNLVAIWRDADGSTVEVEFLGDEQCKLIVFKDPKNPLRVLPEITNDTLVSIGQQIGECSFLHVDQ